MTATGKRITFEDIASVAGIHRTTLSKIANQRGHNATTNNLGKLCNYFECPIEELVEHVPSAEGIINAAHFR